MVHHRVNGIDMYMYTPYYIGAFVWHHVVYTFGPDGAYLYVDGAPGSGRAATGASRRRLT